MQEINCSKGNETFTFKPIKCMCLSCPDFCLYYDNGQKTEIKEFYTCCLCYKKNSQHLAKPWLYVTLSLIRSCLVNSKTNRVAFSIDDYVIDVLLDGDKLSFYYENSCDGQCEIERFVFELDKPDNDVVVNCNAYTAIIETLIFLSKIKRAK